MSPQISITNAARQKRYRDKQCNAQGRAPITDVTGYLYIIHCIGFPYYKIGITTGKPQSRLRSLRPGLPFELDLVYAVKVNNVHAEEALLHQKYAGNNVRGEWFNFTDSELEYLQCELATVLHGQEATG